MNQTSVNDRHSENELPDVTVEQLPARLRDAVARAGWASLMPVQARAIPYVLAGRGVLIQARTGSGKTGAFLLPMLERLDPALSGCQALVLVPTRELAKQVWEQAEVMCANSGLRTVAVYGGVGYGPQNDALRQGFQIVVGTPGRVLDHLIRGTLDMKDLRMLIFDEADRMLSMGFYPDMKEIQKFLPRRSFNACMFSATFPQCVIQTAGEFIREPEFITLSGDHVHSTTTEHVFYTVPAMDKDRALVRIIEMENPGSAIIFCNTKVRVHYINVVLQRFGYDADELSADLSQKNRERVLEKVRRGTLRFLIATDVAARGLDIPALSHVIQFESPEDPEAYIHRAGRTGHAGGPGVAMSIVSDLEKRELLRIANLFSIDMQERPMPTDEDVEQVVAERITALLEAKLRLRDKLQTERSRRFIKVGRSLAESEDESAIIAMLLDDYYQQTFHPPMPAQDKPSELPRVQSSSGSNKGRSRRPNRRR